MADDLTIVDKRRDGKNNTLVITHTDNNGYIITYESGETYCYEKIETLLAGLRQFLTPKKEEVKI